MKKIRLIALGLISAGILAGMTACTNSKKETGTDTDSVKAEEYTDGSDMTAPKDSLAEIFMNPAKKSEIATDSTYAETASGLKYMILREGDGKKPTATSEVTVQYEGKLVDGTIFDSSYSRGEPAAFPLNRVIPGWTEGLQLMKEKGKAVFYIPSAIGYGPQGMPPVIPPNADLIFTVELIKVD